MRRHEWYFVIGMATGIALALLVAALQLTLASVWFLSAYTVIALVMASAGTALITTRQWRRIVVRGHEAYYRLVRRAASQRDVQATRAAECEADATALRAETARLKAQIADLEHDADTQARRLQEARQYIERLQERT
jgi:membrane glycosyltransferase